MVSRSFVVVTDLDGTVLPKPAPGAPTRPIDEGPAYAPLLRLLELGATVVAVTGSKLATHRCLFFDPLPLEARCSGRVLFAVETAKKLYRSNADGQLIEDVRFAAYSEAQAPPLEDAVVAELVAIGHKGIRAFYEDCAQGSVSIIDDPTHMFLRDYLGTAAAANPPVTSDKRQYPRIEVREGNGAVVFFGVPIALGRHYFEVTRATKLGLKPCHTRIPFGISPHPATDAPPCQLTIRWPNRCRLC